MAARTVHVGAMGMLLGGLAYDVDAGRLFWVIVLTVASGFLLLALELMKSGTYLYSGAGMGLWLKLLLFGLGHLFPTALFECYLIGTGVASIASHMPRSVRHRLLWRGGPHAR